MALPDILTGLLRPAAYPHPCADIRLIETHISWVLLTGHYAYKIKKPVRLPFVDFGTLARRRFFCDEELRCNRRFAPSLYLDVVAVRVGADGFAVVGPAVPDDPAVVEWAVRMREFAPDRELVRLLAADALTPDQLRTFGVSLAGIHHAAPRHAGRAAEVEPRVLAPVAENFSTLAALAQGAEVAALLRRIEAATAARAARLRPLLAARSSAGWTRECHGDLHLGNLVLLDGVITAFDCIEFDPNLRWIDTFCDLAFLFMDCAVRGRADLAYAFLDGYLDATGDYEGAALLPFYAVYRAMVRAKVAGIRAAQEAAAADAAGFDEQMLAHLRWAQRWLERPPGRLVLMSGLSGSGKSWLAERLAPLLRAIRLRSDVARRALGDGTEPARPESVDEGRYAPERVLGVYQRLAELAQPILEQGDLVILDATFIDAAARLLVMERAQAAGWPVLIVACTAPRALLEARIRQRRLSGVDPSEADLAVLDRQYARRDPYRADEPVLEVDTSASLDATAIARLADAIATHPALSGHAAAGGNGGPGG